MINTLQHIGIGVEDIGRSYEFYRNYLNFNFKLNNDELDVRELEPMFGRRPRMCMHNSFNPYGGPSLELFKHVDTPPRKRAEASSWEDIGLIELGIEVKGLKNAYGSLKNKGLTFLSGIEEITAKSGEIWKYTYLKDPDDVTIQLLEMGRSKNKSYRICGINHVGIGVLDLDQAISFYRESFGYDQIVFQQRVEENEMSHILLDHGELEIMMLKRSEGSTAALSSFNGGMIKLIHCKDQAGKHFFEGRRFGDVGLTEIAFDTENIVDFHKSLVQRGAKLLVPPTDFDLGLGPRGTLVYIADPEGNVIELVKLKSLFKLPPRLLDWLMIRPMRVCAKMQLI